MFKNNDASRGGGVGGVVAPFRAIILRCLFDSNNANIDGGHLYVNGGSFIVKNSILRNGNTHTHTHIYIQHTKHKFKNKTHKLIFALLVFECLFLCKPKI